MDIEQRQNDSVIAYWGGYGHAEGRKFRTHGHAHEIWTGIPHVLMNAVFLWRHEPGPTASMIEKTAPDTAALGVGTTWWLSPRAQAEGAEAALSEAGFEVMVRMPAMVCQLAKAVRPPMPKSLVIEEASAPDERRVWGEVVGRGFGFDPAQTRAFAECEAAIPGMALKNQYRYLGYVDGEPVAASCLVMARGLAGIYSVATLETARRRGLGSAMTMHAMLEGQRIGADEAVLQASSMGQPIYERMGFRRDFDYVLMRQPPETGK